MRVQDAAAEGTSIQPNHQEALWPSLRTVRNGVGLISDFNFLKLSLIKASEFDYGD